MNSHQRRVRRRALERQGGQTYLTLRSFTAWERAMWADMGVIVAATFRREPSLCELATGKRPCADDYIVPIRRQL